jgi:hypothetical protein
MSTIWRTRTREGLCRNGSRELHGLGAFACSFCGEPHATGQ